jgi:hypothetical protein
MLVCLNADYIALPPACSGYSLSWPIRITLCADIYLPFRSGRIVSVVDWSRKYPRYSLQPTSRGPHGGNWRRPYFVAEGIMRRASRDVSKSAIAASNPSGVICLDEMSDGRHNAAHTGRDREKRAKCARVSLWRRQADRPSLSCGCSPRLAWIRISTYRP